MDLLVGITVWCTIAISIVKFPSAVNSAPIRINFNQCDTAVYIPIIPTQPTVEIQCCPPLPTRPIIDGLPPPSTNFTRVRKAAQCTGEAYARKLNHAYALMRALPDDDPRSLLQQWRIHCAYCAGAFYFENNGNRTGIDVHLGWLFLPWHRLYVYFHERILQKLLGDPTFTLSYWNWDAPFTVGRGTNRRSCLLAGQDFPDAYNDPDGAAYDVNRSAEAMGTGRWNFPDLTFSPAFTHEGQPLYNSSFAELVSSNLNVMYNAMVSGGTTPETFLGLPYREGDPRPIATPPPNITGPGLLEITAHSSVHFWTGLDTPLLYDMGYVPYSGRDPVFFSHHSNIDRLFHIWRLIGPTLGQERDYYSDPDFLNAEFLLYDENSDLRRVTVRDLLDIEKLGYSYQGANDAAWLFYNQSMCSNLSYSDLISQAESYPTPVADENGNYVIESGQTLVTVVDRPPNPNGDEEFLTINGIARDRFRNAGFDVYVDLLDPEYYSVPSSCAEYAGRFSTMAQGRRSFDSNETLPITWKRSITRTITDVQVPSNASKLVVTVVSVFTPESVDPQSISFSSMTIGSV